VEECVLRDPQDAEMDDGFEKGKIGRSVGNSSFFVLGSSFLVGESGSRRAAGAPRRWGVGGNGEGEAALQSAHINRRAVQVGAEVSECLGGGHGCC